MSVALVAAALANKPGNAGAAWTRLSWALGLRRLGFDVHLVEQISTETCADARGHRTSFEASVNRRWVEEVAGAFDLPVSVLCDGEPTLGLTGGDLEELAAEARLLVNVSGHLDIPLLRDRPDRKIYLDLDPGYTQFWEAGGQPGARLEGHDVYATVGLRIGTPGCAIPTLGLRWRPVYQPVVLAEWPERPIRPGAFTTVGSWRGPYGPVEHAGRTFGLKVHEFRRFAALPTVTGEPFEAALDIHPADERDRSMLEECGWRISDPRVAAGTPERFRAFVERSFAELSVAQGVYVETRSGWFSDRSTRYLAAGRPVLVQDTGLPETLPVGEGLLTFRTLEDAAMCVELVASDAERHAKAARALAEELFDSDRVLGELLEDAGVSR